MSASAARGFLLLANTTCMDILDVDAAEHDEPLKSTIAYVGSTCGRATCSASEC